MTNPRLLLAALLLAAAPAHAQPGAEPSPALPHAIVVHLAPITSEAGAPIELAAAIDAPFAETLSARWRAVGDTTWQDVPFERSSGGGWFATLPPARPPGVEYYLRGQDAHGAEVVHFASPTAPHVVRVEASVVDRLEQLDRARLGDRREEITLDVVGHDFGNRYGLQDRFLRSELAYTHRFLREIHQVTFGFGTVDGHTPETDNTSARYRAVRYGFGEVRFRGYESLFVDLRVALATGTQGFTGGIRGALTLGKPWRSNLGFGAEYLGEVGGTGWVRLQWDTAWPVLMGASIVRTDLPGALVSAAGLYVAYDLAYRVADRITMKAQVSYGSRDGAAHFGGGLGAAVDF